MDKIKNLFIIDDDELFAFITKKRVENTHLVDNIEIFKNGQVALDYFNNNPGVIPEIMLVDISMPVMGGVEFLNHFKKFKPELRNKVDIYIITSLDQFDDIINNKNKDSVKDFFTKTFDSLKIIDVIKKYAFKLFT